VVRVSADGRAVGAISKREPVVEPVDRFDAELIGDQFTDERQRRLRGGVGAPGGRPHLVAVLLGDPVTVVAVGDQHVVGPDRGGDRRHPVDVADPFDDVFDPVDDHPSHRLAGCLQHLRQP
jgi:hypothetical protein